MADDEAERPRGVSVTFDLLGPVTARRGAQVLRIGPAGQQALLAYLLMRTGQVVTTDEMVAAVWGECPPHSSRGMVRTYLSRLRRNLEIDLVTRVPGGYRCLVRAEQVDLHRLDSLLLKAKKARANGDVHARSASLGEVLELFGGEPLAGVPGPFAEGQRHRLHEVRWSAVEERIEAELAVGRHHEVLHSLNQVSEQPLRERLVGLFMLALYRSDRQAEALGLYRHTAATLAGELGVDPSPSLQALHEQILRTDPELEAPPQPEPGPAPVRIPRQLPADVPDFVGRRAEIDQIIGYLTSTDQRTPVVIGLSGPGGIGKTTLAVHLAHRVSDRFCDGQLFVPLGDPVPPHETLGNVLQTLGLGAENLPATTEARAALLRSLLAERRMLLVLDSAPDADAVQSLLPGSSSCAVLITSRCALPDVPGLRHTVLAGLTPGESVAFLTAAAGPDAETTALQTIAAHCAGHPLALRIMAARLDPATGSPAAAVARRLARPGCRLDELSCGTLAVRTCFQLNLAEVSAAAARAFPLLAAPDDHSISRHSAAALIGVQVEQAERLVEELRLANLLSAGPGGRARFHQLIALFAREQLDERAQWSALDRLAAHYVATMRSVRGGEVPHLPRWDAPATTAVELCDADADAVAGWREDEWHNVVALISQLATANPAAAADLLTLIDPYLDEAGHWDAWERTVHRVLAAASAAACEPTRLAAMMSLGGVHLRRGNLAGAESSATAALSLAEDIGCSFSAATAANDLGNLRLAQGRPADAIDCYLRSERAFATLGYEQTAALIRAHVGNAELKDGRPREALRTLRASLDRLDPEVSTSSRAHVQYFLGKAYSELGEPAAALRCLERSLATAERLGHRRFHARVSATLAASLLRDGQRSAARFHSRLALSTFLQVGDVYAAEHARQLLAECEIELAAVCS